MVNILMGKLNMTAGAPGQAGYRCGSPGGPSLQSAGEYGRFSPIIKEF
ncbi:MAG: hypothetical protein ACLP2P_00240 [Desulfobaccales bacterium]